MEATFTHPMRYQACHWCGFDVAEANGAECLTEVKGEWLCRGCYVRATASLTVILTDENEN